MRLLRSEWSLNWSFYNWYQHKPALKIVLCWISPSIHHITKCLLYHQPWENHMHLNNVLMHVWQHCEGWRTDIDDGMQVPLTNYPIVSLFNSWTLLWGTISLLKDVYFYQARNELILNFGSDALGTHLIAMGFYKDDSVLIKSDSHTPAINPGFKAKRQMTGSCKWDLQAVCEAVYFFFKINCWIMGLMWKSNWHGYEMNFLRKAVLKGYLEATNGPKGSRADS